MSKPDKLTEAKAHYVYLKNLPISAFKPVFGANGSFIKHSVGVRNDTVQTAYARVKRPEVLAAKEQQ